MLVVDGKSAYKQRKLAWSARHLIGFRTKINNKVCYVALATPPFGLHNAGHIYQKNLEAKLERACGNTLWLEYIDDVAVRLGTTQMSPQELQWRGNTFLWFLTKTGEIMNNKFTVYRNSVTLLGVNYNLHTDRFTPKLASFYRFALEVAKVIRQNHCTVAFLESLAGRCNWLFQGNHLSMLQPLYDYLGQTRKKFLYKGKIDYKRTKKQSIPMTTFLGNLLLQICIKMVESYTMYNTPKLTAGKRILYIVVDSNPAIAGGYMIIQKRSVMFQPVLTPDKLMQIGLPHVPASFIKRYKLESLLHSHRYEGLGLLHYLQQHQQFLSKIVSSIDAIIVFSDNLGLVTNLVKGNPKGPLPRTEHTLIHKIFRDLDVPVQFQWLRRSTPIIELADQIGRSPPFGLNNRTAELLRKYFSRDFFIPTLFETTSQLPLLLPQEQWDKIKNPTKLPLLLIPYNAELAQVKHLVLLATNARCEVLVGFPCVRKRWLKEYFTLDEYLSIPHITTEFFTGTTVKRTKTQNFPYCFGIPTSKHGLAWE